MNPAGTIASLFGKPINSGNTVLNLLPISDIKIEWYNDNAVVKLNLPSLLTNNIVRAGKNLSSEIKSDPLTGQPYVDISDISRYHLNGVPFVGGFAGEDSRYNLPIVSSDNSVSISASNLGNGVNAVDLKVKARPQSMIFDDGDRSVAIDTDGPITVKLLGSNLKLATSEKDNEVVLRDTSILGINGVPFGGQNIFFVDPTNKVSFTPDLDNNQVIVSLAPVASGNQSLDGWLPESLTMTYSAADTLDVAGDPTVRYSVGDKIELTQNSTKKWFVVKQVLSTQLKLDGLGTYALTNNTISNIKYSKSDRPIGFPISIVYETLFGRSGSVTTLQGSDFVLKDSNSSQIKTSAGTIEVQIGTGNALKIKDSNGFVNGYMAQTAKTQLGGDGSNLASRLELIGDGQRTASEHAFHNLILRTTNAGQNSTDMYLGVNATSTTAYIQAVQYRGFATGVLEFNPKGGMVRIGGDFTTTQGDHTTKLQITGLALGSNQFDSRTWFDLVGKTTSGEQQNFIIDRERQQTGDASPASATLRLMHFVNGGLNSWIAFQGNRVGINHSNPQYTFHVNGSAAAVNFVTTSDKKFKKNIVDLKSSLSKVLGLRPVSFDWTKEYVTKNNVSDTRQIGFIAQEVEEIVPEVVIESVGLDNYKSIDYARLTTILVGAIQELQDRIDKLEKRA